MLRLWSTLMVLVSLVAAPAVSFSDDDDDGIDYNVSSGHMGLPDQVVVQGTELTDGVTRGDSESQATNGEIKTPEPPPGCDTALATDADDKTCGTATRNADGEPAVTLTDLAIFRPAPPALTGDPVGYGLMNAPANIVATATEQTVDGELFARPVQVRFVPVQYTFDYGDGATRSSDTGGATWEALGVPQFTPTATTHAYGDRGTYTVTVTVAYAPFVNFGSGSRPVPGTVSATSGGYGIQIVEARTALVEHDCHEDPTGVGCPVP